MKKTFHKMFHKTLYLFTNIPIEETIQYLIHQIYNEKKVSQICSRTIFRCLMYKLTTQCAFEFKQNLFKQTEGCNMGGPYLNIG